MKITLLASLAASAAAFQMPNQRNLPITKAARDAVNVVTAASIFAISVLSPQPAAAVSGGGLDYAGIDITGQDFSNSKAYKG